jgi:hypothetical protein
MSTVGPAFERASYRVPSFGLRLVRPRRVGLERDWRAADERGEVVVRAELDAVFGACVAGPSEPEVDDHLFAVDDDPAIEHEVVLGAVGWGWGLRGVEHVAPEPPRNHQKHERPRARGHLRRPRRMKRASAASARPTAATSVVELGATEHPLELPLCAVAPPAPPSDVPDEDEEEDDDPDADEDVDPVADEDVEDADEDADEDEEEDEDVDAVHASLASH